MARPQILQELRHGKLLTQGNFPQFVDTFNYTVKRLENLKGDADVRPNGGQVTVDNTDPEHPVIRFVGEYKAAREGAGAWVDSEISALHLSSVQEEKWTDPDTGEDTKYHQFFGFTDHVLNDYELSDGLDVVVRDYFTTGGNGARTNYISLSGLAKKLSSNVEVDSWATQGAQRSIDWNTQNDKKYLQLYNFDKPGYDDTLRVNLVYGQHRYATKYGSGEYPDPYVEFVVRDRNNNIVKYDALDIYAPPISASDITDLTTVISAIVDRGCSCDLGPLSAKVDQLSSDLSNYWKVGGTNDDNCYGQSIGNSSQVLAIDIDNGGLWYESSQTIDWHNCELYNQNGADGPGDICLNWADRYGYDGQGVPSFDWGGRTLRDSSATATLDWDHRTLYDSNNHIVADWERQYLLDRNTIIAVNWADRHLVDSSQNVTLNWQDRMLEGDWAVNGNLSVEQGATLTIGNTTLTEAQLQQLLALLQVVPNALQGV